jgi:hypothetical protein
VSAGIQAQLDAIRADFGIAANADLADGLRAQFRDNLEAGLVFDYQPARCAVDAKASIEASAKCEGSVSPGMVAVQCKGTCSAEVSATAKCEGSAELYCTAPSVEASCTGECRGSCTPMVDINAQCNGSCKGTCMGECSAYAKNAKGELVCDGNCTGTCMGRCEAQVEAAAKCEGTCNGECTVKSTGGGCQGSVRAECRASASASFMCQGRCEGEFEPPTVKAECQASAKAQAKLKVQCTPPRAELKYAFKASASVQFKAALNSFLEVRLPALGEALGRANVVGTAGDDLRGAAGAGFKDAVGKLQANFNLKLLWGLDCAARELDDAQDTVMSAQSALAGRITLANTIAKLPYEMTKK